MRNCPRPRRHQVPEAVSGVIPSNAIFIHIHLEHILRPIRVMLERGQALPQPSAALVKEQPSGDAPRRIAEAMQNLGPPVSEKIIPDQLVLYLDHNERT